MVLFMDHIDSYTAALLWYIYTNKKKCNTELFGFLQTLYHCFLGTASESSDGEGEDDPRLYSYCLSDYEALKDVIIFITFARIFL